MPKISVDITLHGLEFMLWAHRAPEDISAIRQLLNELSLGESFLRIDESGNIFRVLRIVKLIINDQEKGTLLEDYHITADGRRKDRQRSPSGKIGNHEDPEEAVVREMLEELHLEKKSYAFVMGNPYTEERRSESYPAVRSIYEIHPAQITLAADVKIEDGHATIDKEDGKKRLFFKWSGKDQTP